MKSVSDIRRTYIILVSWIGNIWISRTSSSFATKMRNGGRMSDLPSWKSSKSSQINYVWKLTIAYCDCRSKSYITLAPIQTQGFYLVLGSELLISHDCPKMYNYILINPFFSSPTKTLTLYQWKLSLWCYYNYHNTIIVVYHDFQFVSPDQCMMDPNTLSDILHHWIRYFCNENSFVLQLSLNGI